MPKISRKARMVKAFSGGKSVKDISRDFGLDSTYVYRILKEQGVNLGVGEKRNEILSPTHQLLGKLIRKNRVFHFDELRKTFTDQINMSSQRLRLIEYGQYDLTLTDLLKILPALGIKFSEIDDILEELKTE